jgi:hypothetical protein
MRRMGFIISMSRLSRYYIKSHEKKGEIEMHWWLES